MGSLSIWHWLIVLAVVVLVFGTKKLRNLGGDVGGAIKNFKQAMREGESDAEAGDKPAAPPERIAGEPQKPAGSATPSKQDTKSG